MEQRPLTTIENSGIEYGNLSEDAYALLCGLVQALASEQGRDLSAQEIQTAAQIIWEGVHGTVALRLSTDKDPWFQRLALDAHLDIEAAATLFVGSIQGLVIQALFAGDVQAIQRNAPGVFATYLRGISRGTP